MTIAEAVEIAAILIDAAKEMGHDIDESIGSVEISGLAVYDSEPQSMDLVVKCRRCGHYPACPFYAWDFWSRNTPLKRCSEAE